MAPPCLELKHHAEVAPFDPGEAFEVSEAGIAPESPRLVVTSAANLGHITKEERPAEVNAAMIDFLRGLPG